MPEQGKSYAQANEKSNSWNAKGSNDFAFFLIYWGMDHEWILVEALENSKATFPICDWTKYHAGELQDVVVF